MDSFILTGPIGAGKSTQAKLLSSELGMPVCVYDEVKDNYRYKIGLDRDKAHAINEKEGIYAMLCYMNQFKAKILAPIINDHPGHIIDLGAGAHSFDEPEQILLAKQAFKEIKNIILLLPSSDLATNINSLPGIKEGWVVNTFLIMHPSNELLSNKTIYTNDNTPQDTMLEIIDAIGS